MSEFQPQEPTEIQFCLGNHEFAFTPDDLPRAYTHDDPQYDHFLYVNSWKNGKPKTALLFFREVFETHDIDMDELLEFFADEEVDIVPQGEPPEMDLTLYEHWQKTNKRLPLVIKLVPDDVEHNEYIDKPELKFYDLPPTLENEVGRFANILANMPDQDIIEEFQLPQPPQTKPQRWAEE